MGGPAWEGLMVHAGVQRAISQDRKVRDKRQTRYAKEFGLYSSDNGEPQKIF